MVKDMNKNKKKENINRSKFIKKLENVGHRNLNIITMNGVTVASICYSEVIQDEEDKDIIYLRVGEVDSDIEDVYINYKAIRYIREFSDCIEITV